MGTIISNKLLLNIVAVVGIISFIRMFLTSQYDDIYAIIAYICLLYVLLYQLVILNKKN